MKDKAAPAREAALEALWEIEIRAAYATVALTRVLSRRHLSPEDRELATELVYGTVRRLGTLDWVLGLYLKEPLARLTPWIRGALRLGAYQLLFLPRIPPAVAVDEGVKQAREHGHRGTAGLVNAVLRRLSREKDHLPWPSLDQDPIAHLTVVYSHPSWLVERWVARWGVTETIALCRANNEPPPLVMRVNSLRTSPSEMVARLQEKGVVARPSRLAPDGVIVEQEGRALLALVQAGYGLIQDESSMLPGYLLDPKEGEKVLDACCGPGGKTTHLAELQKDQGKVMGLDLHESKLRQARENATRLGLSSITFRQGDARWLGRESSLRESFHRVLVDAPCSGLGVLRRRADARWRKKPEDLAVLPLLQLEILEGAAACLSPGGVLVYSTCTIEPEENQGVVEAFLKRHHNFRLEPVLDHLPSLARDFLKAKGHEGPYLSLLPHIHGTDGFFAARLRRLS